VLFLIKGLYIILHLLIALYDFSFYRVPNLFLGALLVLYGLYVPFYVSMGQLTTELIVFAIVFVIGFGLYALKYIGAGDAKYIAVASIWVGYPGVLYLLLYVSVMGGLLAVLYLFLPDHLARFSDWMWSHIQKAESRFPLLQKVWAGSGTGPEAGKRGMIEGRMIPYGIAIAIGSICMITIF